MMSKKQNAYDIVSASECSMFYCVNQYSAHVSDGKIEQKITWSWRNDSASHSQDSDLLYRPGDTVNSTFWVESLAAQAMNSFMSKTFTGSGGINDFESGSAFSSDVIHALYETMNYTKRMENLAISMTNNIRQQNDSGSMPLSGLAFRTESYVKVRWAWFSYPAALVVLSLAYLLGTIIESTYREASIWKSNILVTLFHGQGLELIDPPRVAVTTMSEMSKLYKNIKVELVGTDVEGWKFVQKEDE